MHGEIRQADVIGVRLRISGDPGLLTRLAELCADLLRSGTGLAQPQVIAEVTLDGRDDVGTALSQITGTLVRESPMLCVHAAVARGPAGILAIPGASGLGKTTLAGALAAAGFGYLSDEVLAVDRKTREVSAFPRPLALAPAGLVAAGLPDLGGEVVNGEIVVRPGAVGHVDAGGSEIADIILATRRAGPCLLEPFSRGQAAAVMMRRSFNHFRDAADTFTLVAECVRRARVWHAEYGEARDLVAAIEETIPVS